MFSVAKNITSIIVTGALLLIGGCDRAISDDSIMVCPAVKYPSSILVTVRDSLNDDTLVDTATVTIVATSIILFNGSPTITTFSLDYSDNFGLYRNLDSLSGHEKVSIVVHADGYYPFVTKGIDFVTVAPGAVCNQGRVVDYTVYLCPVGSACI